MLRAPPGRQTFLRKSDDGEGDHGAEILRGLAVGVVQSGSDFFEDKRHSLR